MTPWPVPGKPIDPRTRRTRHMLQGALRDLLLRKRFEEVSVSDVTEAATLNRATFYDHYADKFALLEDMIRGEFAQLLEARQLRFAVGCPEALQAIILAVCDYLVHLGGGCHEHARQFYPFVEATIIAQLREVLLDGLARKPIPQGPQVSLIATAASWAIYGSASEWARDPKRPPSEQIVPSILGIVAPMLLSTPA